METVLRTNSAAATIAFHLWLGGDHLSKLLLANGYRVIGLDSMMDHYDVSLEEACLAQLENPEFVPVVRNKAPGLETALFETH